MLGLRLRKLNIHKLLLCSKQDASHGIQGFCKQSLGLEWFVGEQEGGFYSQWRDYETLQSFECWSCVGVEARSIKFATWETVGIVRIEPQSQPSDRSSTQSEGSTLFTLQRSCGSFPQAMGLGFGI